MSPTTTSSRTSCVQWLIESRPPSLTWSRPHPRHATSRQLDLTDHEPDYAEADRARTPGRPDERGEGALGGKTATRAPMPSEWSATLALALTQSLIGLRPVAQLNRWVAEEVLVAISIHQRRRLSAHGRIARPDCTALDPDPAP